MEHGTPSRLTSAGAPATMVPVDATLTGIDEAVATPVPVTENSHRGSRPRRARLHRARSPRNRHTHRESSCPTYELASNALFGENRRVGKKLGGTLTTGFLYQDGLNVVAQLDGSGNLVARYVFGSKRNLPDYFTTSAGTFRILSDHLGSPRLIVNTSTGAVAEEIDYDEFGNVTNDTSSGLTPFGFAGGLYDKDTALVRFGARDYDASVGRWTSKDSSRFSGGMNLYGYALSDPVDFRDQNGRDPTGSAIGCLIAGGAGFVAGLLGGGVTLPFGGEGVLLGPLAAGALGGALGCGAGAAAGAPLPPLSGISCDKPNNDNGDGNDQCDEQYEIDGNTCRALQTKKSRALCWQSAIERLNACRDGNPIPPLQGWWN